MPKVIIIIPPAGNRIVDSGALGAWFDALKKVGITNPEISTPGRSGDPVVLTFEASDAVLEKLEEIRPDRKVAPPADSHSAATVAARALEEATANPIFSKTAINYEGSPDPFTREQRDNAIPIADGATTVGYRVNVKRGPEGILYTSTLQAKLRGSQRTFNPKAQDNTRQRVVPDPRNPENQAWSVEIPAEDWKAIKDSSLLHTLHLIRDPRNWIHTTLPTDGDVVLFNAGAMTPFAVDQLLGLLHSRNFEATHLPRGELPGDLINDYIRLPVGQPKLPAAEGTPFDRFLGGVATLKVVPRVEGLSGWSRAAQTLSMGWLGKGRKTAIALVAAGLTTLGSHNDVRAARPGMAPQITTTSGTPFSPTP